MSEAELERNPSENPKSNLPGISPINLPNKQHAKEVINRVLAKNMSNNNSSSSGGILLSSSNQEINDKKICKNNMNSSPINLPTATSSGSNLIQMNASPRGSYRRSANAAATVKHQTQSNNSSDKFIQSSSDNFSAIQTSHLQNSNLQNCATANNKMSKISEKGMTAIQHSSSYMDQLAANSQEINCQQPLLINSSNTMKNTSVIDLRKSNQNVSSTGNLGCSTQGSIQTIKSPSHSCISTSNSNIHNIAGSDRNKTPVNTPPINPNSSNNANVLLRRNWKQQQQLQNQQQNHGLVSTSNNQKYPPNTIIGKGHSNLNIDMCTSSNMNLQYNDPSSFAGHATIFITFH